MTDTADYTPAQVAAFDQARAKTMKEHSYTYSPDGWAQCACGEKVGVQDIALHVDTVANAAGRRAANEVSE